YRFAAAGISRGRCGSTGGRVRDEFNDSNFPRRVAWIGRRSRIRRQFGTARGRLLRLPVLTSAALVGDDSPATNFVGLVNPNEILWNRGDVILNTSTNAGIVMDSDPEAIGPIVSMFQSDTIALKA